MSAGAGYGLRWGGGRGLIGATMKPISALIRRAGVWGLAGALAGSNLGWAQTNAPVKTAWGGVHPATAPGETTLEVSHLVPNDRLVLPGEIVGITEARVRLSPTTTRPLYWSAGAESAPATVWLTGLHREHFPLRVEVETAAKTGQVPGGRISLLAHEAQIQGTGARLVAAPAGEFIGDWTNRTDVVQWDYKPSRWGRYDLSLAVAGEGEAELVVEVAGQKFTVKRPPTGGSERYQTIPVGRLYLANEQRISVRVAAGGAGTGLVANLKAAILEPAPEGADIRQTGAEPITLPASQAITHSVTMRYEPLPNKNCLGFWVNAKDWAEWYFQLAQAGTYSAKISLGCGKGQGGSEIEVSLDGQTRTFLVPDTGDYHTHTWVDLGEFRLARAADYALSVKPLKKKAGAIMDIESVVLTPVAK